MGQARTPDKAAHFLALAILIILWTSSGLFAAAGDVVTSAVCRDSLPSFCAENGVSLAVSVATCDNVTETSLRLLVSPTWTAANNTSSEQPFPSLLLARYLNQSGVPVAVDAGNFGAASVTNSTAVQATQGYAGWVSSPTTAAAAASAAQELPSALLLRDGDLQWSDVLPSIRAMVSWYGAKLQALPYAVEVPLVLYRRDALAAVSAAPASTWTDLLELLERMRQRAALLSNTTSSSAGAGAANITANASSNSGTVGNASASPVAGFCNAMPSGCERDGDLLVSIWASVGLAALPAPTSPTELGRLLEAQLRGGAALHALALALELYRSLMALAPAGAGHAPCQRPSLTVALQQCAVVVGASSSIKVALWRLGGRQLGRRWWLEPVLARSATSGVALTTPLPGSAVAAAAGTGALESCGNGSGPNSITCLYAWPATLRTSSSGEPLLTRAVYLGRDALGFQVNASVAPHLQYAAWRAAAVALGANNSWRQALLPEEGAATIIRASQLQDVKAWVSYGYNEQDITAYLSALGDSLQGPLTFTAPRLPLPAATRWAEIMAAAANEAAFSDRDARMIAQETLHDLLAAYDAGRRDILSALALHLHLASDTGLASSSRVPPSKGAVVGSIAGSAVGVAAVAALSVLWAWRGVILRSLRARLRFLDRTSSAPGFGPETTLMLTDVQGSTQLWEALPAVVMDEALSLHNDAFRQLLPRYRGYECHTEGDSFILAFHTAIEAAGFALEIQMALLQLDWPQELLEHELCAVVRQGPPPGNDSNEGAAAVPAGAELQHAGPGGNFGLVGTGLDGDPTNACINAGGGGSGPGSVPLRPPSDYVDASVAGPGVAEPWGLQAVDEEQATSETSAERLAELFLGRGPRRQVRRSQTFTSLRSLSGPDRKTWSAGLRRPTPTQAPPNHEAVVEQRSLSDIRAGGEEVARTAPGGLSCADPQQQAMELRSAPVAGRPRLGMSPPDRSPDDTGQRGPKSDDAVQGALLSLRGSTVSGEPQRGSGRTSGGSNSQRMLVSSLSRRSSLQPGMSGACDATEEASLRLMSLSQQANPATSPPRPLLMRIASMERSGRQPWSQSADTGSNANNSKSLCLMYNRSSRRSSTCTTPPLTGLLATFRVSEDGDAVVAGASGALGGVEISLDAPLVRTHINAAYRSRTSADGESAEAGASRGSRLSSGYRYGTFGFGRFARRSSASSGVSNAATIGGEVPLIVVGDPSELRRRRRLRAARRSSSVMDPYPELDGSHGSSGGEAEAGGDNSSKGNTGASSGRGTGARLDGGKAAGSSSGTGSGGRAQIGILKAYAAYLDRTRKPLEDLPSPTAQASQRDVRSEASALQAAAVVAISPEQLVSEARLDVGPLRTSLSPASLPPSPLPAPSPSLSQQGSASEDRELLPQRPSPTFSPPRRGREVREPLLASGAPKLDATSECARAEAVLLPARAPAASVTEAVDSPQPTLVVLQHPNSLFEGLKPQQGSSPKGVEARWPPADALKGLATSALRDTQAPGLTKPQSPSFGAPSAGADVVAAAPAGLSGFAAAAGALAEPLANGDEHSPQSDIWLAPRRSVSALPMPASVGGSMSTVAIPLGSGGPMAAAGWPAWRRSVGRSASASNIVGGGGRRVPPAALSAAGGRGGRTGAAALMMRRQRAAVDYVQSPLGRQACDAPRAWSGDAAHVTTESVEVVETRVSDGLHAVAGAAGLRTSALASGHQQQRVHLAHLAPPTGRQEQQQQEGRRVHSDWLPSRVAAGVPKLEGSARPMPDGGGKGASLVGGQGPPHEAAARGSTPQGRPRKRSTTLSDPGLMPLPGAGGAAVDAGWGNGAPLPPGSSHQPALGPSALATAPGYAHDPSQDPSAGSAAPRAPIVGVPRMSATRRPPMRSVTPPPRFTGQHLPAHLVGRSSHWNTGPLHPATAPHGINSGLIGRTAGLTAVGMVPGAGAGVGRIWGGLEALMEAYSGTPPGRWLPAVRGARGSMSLSSVALLSPPGHNETGSGISAALMLDGRSSDGRAAMGHPDSSAMVLGSIGGSSALPQLREPPFLPPHGPFPPRDRAAGGGGGGSGSARNSNTGRLMSALSSALRSRRISLAVLGDSVVSSSSRRLHALAGPRGSTHATAPDSSPTTFLEAMLQFATAPQLHNSHHAAALTSTGSGNGSGNGSFAGLRRSVTPPGLPGGGSTASDSRRVHALHRLVVVGSGSREGEGLTLAVAGGSGGRHSPSDRPTAGTDTTATPAASLAGAAMLRSESGGAVGLAGRAVLRGPSGGGAMEMTGSGAASSANDSLAAGQVGCALAYSPQAPASSSGAYLANTYGSSPGTATPPSALEVNVDEQAPEVPATDRFNSFLGHERSGAMRGWPKARSGRASLPAQWGGAESRVFGSLAQQGGSHPLLAPSPIGGAHLDGSAPGGAQLPPHQLALAHAPSSRFGTGSGSSVRGAAHTAFRALSLPMREAGNSEGASDSPGQHSPALSPRASLHALDSVDRPGSTSSPRWTARPPASAGGSFARSTPLGSSISRHSSLAAQPAAPPPLPVLTPTGSAATMAGAAEAERTSASVRLSPALRQSRSAPWRSSRGGHSHSGRLLWQAQARPPTAAGLGEPPGASFPGPEQERASWTAGVLGRPQAGRQQPALHPSTDAGSSTVFQAVRLAAFTTTRSVRGGAGPAPAPACLPSPPAGAPTDASSPRAFVSTSASASAAAAAAATSSAVDSFDEQPRSSRSALLPSPAGSYTRAAFAVMQPEVVVGGGHAAAGRGLSPLRGPSGRQAGGGPPGSRMSSLGRQGRVSAAGSQLEGDAANMAQEAACGELLRSCDSVTQTDAGRGSKGMSEDRDLLMLTTGNTTGQHASLSGGAGAGTGALNTVSSASLRASRHALSMAAPSPVASMTAITQSAASVTAAYAAAGGSGTKTAGGGSRAGRRSSMREMLTANENLLSGLARRLDSLVLPSVGGANSDMPQWDAAAREGMRSRQASGATTFVGRLGAGVVHRIANSSKRGLGPSAAVMDFPIAFRGFRVRCGMHSGLEWGRDVFWTKVSGRRAYSGPAMVLAKAVSDLVPGGMVVLTADTFALLQPWPNPEALPGAIVWCRGRFRVVLGEAGGGGAAPSAEVDIYQLLCPQLLARQPHLERRPWRGAQQTLPGVLSAPLGQLALVLVKVVGVQVLSSWSQEVTSASLQVFGSAACEVLSAWGGFPASLDSSTGTLLAAFREPALALGFMHALLDVLRDAEWPHELLEHELGEPLYMPVPPAGTGGTGGSTTPGEPVAATAPPECPTPPYTREAALASGGPLAFRGLRVRCVADVASVRVDLGCATAAALYEARDPKAFKSLRRMLRLAHMGEVLCSGLLVAQVLAGPPAALATLHDLLAFAPLTAAASGLPPPPLSAPPSTHHSQQQQQSQHQPSRLPSPSPTLPRMAGSITQLGRLVGAGGPSAGAGSAVTTASGVLSQPASLASPIMPANARLTGKEASRSAVYQCTRRRPMRRSVMGNADFALVGSVGGVYGSAAAGLYSGFGASVNFGYASEYSAAAQSVAE